MPDCHLCGDRGSCPRLLQRCFPSSGHRPIFLKPPARLGGMRAGKAATDRLRTASRITPRRSFHRSADHLPRPMQDAPCWSCISTTHGQSPSEHGNHQPGHPCGLSDGSKYTVSATSYSRSRIMLTWKCRTVVLHARGHLLHSTAQLWPDSSVVLAPVSCGSPAIAFSFRLPSGCYGTYSSSTRIDISGPSGLH